MGIKMRTQHYKINTWNYYFKSKFNCFGEICNEFQQKAHMNCT